MGTENLLVNVPLFLSRKRGLDQPVLPNAFPAPAQQYFPGNPAYSTTNDPWVTTATGGTSEPSVIYTWPGETTIINNPSVGTMDLRLTVDGPGVCPFLGVAVFQTGTDGLTKYFTLDWEVYIDSELLTPKFTMENKVTYTGNYLKGGTVIGSLNGSQAPVPLRFQDSLEVYAQCTAKTVDITYNRAFIRILTYPVP